MYGYTNFQLERFADLPRATVLYDALQNERENNLVLRGRVARLVALLNEKKGI